MLATIALLLLAWQEPGTSTGGDALVVGEGHDLVLAEARGALERANHALSAGNMDTARAEAGLVVELLAPLPPGEGLDAAAHLLWMAGFVARDSGAPAIAREAWSHVSDHRERTLPAYHPDLLRVRGNLALALEDMGDLEGACALQERVLVGFQRIAPENHFELLRARAVLAETVYALGDVERARQLYQEALVGLAQTKSEDHPALLDVRRGLAEVMYEMGDFEQARSLFEAAIAGYERTLPEHHPFLIAARSGLAGTMKARGHLEGARALQELVVEGIEGQVPRDDPWLVSGRRLLADTMSAMGDLEGARALLEAVCATCERTLPEGDPDRIRAFTELAKNLHEMGEFERAHAFQARAVTELERTHVEDDPRLRRARRRLAAMKFQVGDLGEARTILEGVLSTLEGFLPHDDAEVLRTQTALATILSSMGDLSGARALEEAVLAAREQALPADHRDVIRARANLAVTLERMGDLTQGRELKEAVVSAYERTLPDGHPELIGARHNLAVALWLTGDLHGARELQESVVAALEQNPTDDPSDLLLARLSLAHLMYRMDQHTEARALAEATLAACARGIPEENPQFVNAFQVLGESMLSAGDPAAAGALFEGVLAVRERTLPKGSPPHLRALDSLARAMLAMGDRFGARLLFEAILASREQLHEQEGELLRDLNNVAAAMFETGDAAGARTLFETVLEEQGRYLPADDPDLLDSRSNLAATMVELGDFDGARGHFEVVVAGREKAYPEDHPDLLAAQHNLASTLFETGDLVEARALAEAVLEVRERTLEEGHEGLLASRQTLAVTMCVTGDLDGARKLGRELAGGVLRRLARSSELSPRAARELAAHEVNRFPTLRLLIDPEGAESNSPILFDVAETVRATAGAGRVSADDPLRPQLSRLRADLNDLVSGGPREGESLEEFTAEVVRLTLGRDRVERAIRTALAERGGATGTVRAEDVAEALAEGATAVGFQLHEKSILDSEARNIRSVGDVLTARVLTPDGLLAELELGPAGEIENLARAWRAAIGVPLNARGLGVGQSEGAGRDEHVLGRALRERVFDPILEVVGDAERIHLCLDSLLFTVPVEALPLDETGESRLGDRVRIVHEVSFARLLSSRTPAMGEPSALLVGGVDYDGAGTAFVAAVSVPIEGTRSGAALSYASLPATGEEVRAIAREYHRAFEREPTLLVEEAGTKAAFHLLAPGKRHLHVATHGWFAPETVKSTLDARPDDALWSRLDARETVTGLAPLTLCGLAFAGANQGRDSLGRVPGIMTAEELAGIDLSACDLAVLSACETNVGIRRAGQGIQSLQTALHAAGARTAITSLWKVDDAATRKLMERFYTYLWVEEMGKADALWKAKCDLRAEGHPVRDWAAWVLSGDPE